MGDQNTGLISGGDSALRCAWPGSDDLYLRYHDNEWGKPVADDFRLFEKICLEGFQSGLSWLTILRKRENFRNAFAGFDFNRVAKFTQVDVERLLQDPGIIRHRGKIESTINNAGRARELARAHGSLAAFFWAFEPSAAERPRRVTRGELMKMATTPASIRLSKQLKQLGFSFVGPTTVYAFMQAMGLVNDHLDGCAVRERAERARERFRRPLRA